MIDIKTIQIFLKDILEPINIPDYGLNGIQVENEGEIKKITFAVDASIESINFSIKNNCNLLIVHHGFFWGKVLPVTGTFKKRIKLLIENDIGLIAYHLPLDSHIELGNNSQILKKLGADKLENFGSDKGNNIGWMTKLDNYIFIEEVYNKLGIVKEANSIYLAFGKKEILNIAVISGRGSPYFEEAIEKKIDLFITGEEDHTLFHKAKENHVNVLFAGHYFTEVFGIKAIMELIKDKFKLETFFFDFPTNL